jgi:putative transposase
MGLKYWSGAHTKHRLVYHIVWIPKYRKRVLKGDVASRIKELLYEACEINRWWIEENNVLEDHIHILIQIRPTDKLSDVVKRLKGGTSRIIREEFPDLKEFLWGNSFWATGYFAETVGRFNYDKVKEYIREQNATD